jgi:hypothetical protein
VDADVPKDEHPDVAIEAGAIEGAVTVGTVGKVGEMLPVTSGAAGVGRSAAELTPRLPISVEARGMPILGLPPSVVGAVELGLEDAAMLLEPEPHMPDMPAVSSVPVVVDSPEPGVIPDIVDIDGVAAIPDDMSIEAAVFPATLPAVAADPAIAIPPPS